MSAKIIALKVIQDELILRIPTVQQENPIILELENFLQFSGSFTVHRIKDATVSYNGCYSKPYIINFCLFFSSGIEQRKFNSLETLNCVRALV